MWIQKTKAGTFRFCERYIDPVTEQQKTVSVTMDKNNASTRKHAAAILQRKIDGKLSKLGAPEEITLHDLIEKYNAYQFATFRESTAQQNKFQLVGIERALGSDALINKIKTGYVVDKLTATGKSATWKNEKIRHFKALMRWAYQNEYLASLDSVDKLKPFPDKTAREKIQDKYMEREELQLVVDGMTHRRWKMLTEFLALSGLRIGEAMALRNRDVDFQARQIHVTKTYAQNCGTVNDPKTLASRRDVPMQPELFNVCKKIKAYMRDQKVSYVQNDLFFPGEDGSFLNYASYSKYFRENTERILKHRLTVHALRHTHTSLMAAAGVSLDVISRRLGHEDSGITKEIYFHVTEQLQEMDARAVQDVAILG